MAEYQGALKAIVNRKSGDIAVILTLKQAQAAISDMSSAGAQVHTPVAIKQALKKGLEMLEQAA